MARHCFVRLEAVRHHALAKPAVWDHDDVIRQHAYARRAPADIVDVPSLSGLQSDEVADPDRFFHEDVNAGEQIPPVCPEAPMQRQVRLRQGHEMRGNGYCPYP